MNTYKKAWGEKGHTALYNMFRKHMPTVIPFLAEPISQKGLQVIEGLDVGAGNGPISLELIESLERVGIKVASWDAVDISQEQLQDFANSVGEDKRFRFFVADWATFITNRQYNFVFSRQAWYGIGSWQNEPEKTNSLMKFYRVIKEGGLGLIVIAPTDNLLTSTSNHIRQDGIYKVNGEAICEELDRLSIPYSLQIINVPVPKVLEGGELTEAGRAIFNYILHMQDMSQEECRLVGYLKDWFSRHGNWVSSVWLIWFDK